jgi:hypothetical protein
MGCSPWSSCISYLLLGSSSIFCCSPWGSLITGCLSRSSPITDCLQVGLLPLRQPQHFLNSRDDLLAAAPPTPLRFFRLRPWMVEPGVIIFSLPLLLMEAQNSGFNLEP